MLKKLWMEWVWFLLLRHAAAKLLFGKCNWQIVLQLYILIKKQNKQLWTLVLLLTGAVCSNFKLMCQCQLLWDGITSFLIITINKAEMIASMTIFSMNSAVACVQMSYRKYVWVSSSAALSDHLSSAITENWQTHFLPWLSLSHQRSKLCV